MALKAHLLFCIFSDNKTSKKKFLATKLQKKNFWLQNFKKNFLTTKLPLSVRHLHFCGRAKHLSRLVGLVCNIFGYSHVRAELIKEERRLYFGVAESSCKQWILSSLHYKNETLIISIFCCILQCFSWQDVYCGFNVLTNVRFI